MRSIRYTCYCALCGTEWECIYPIDQHLVAVVCSAGHRAGIKHTALLWSWPPREVPNSALESWPLDA
jgi:hypothetical protein